MSGEHRARGKLKISKRNTPSVQGRARGFASGVQSDTTTFASVQATAAAVQKQIVVVDDAETQAKKRIPGAAAARNTQRALLVTMLESGLAQVQAIADASPDYDTAVKVLQTAGFPIAIVPSRTKEVLTVKQGPQAGSVELSANATALKTSKYKKSCFNWQFTLDGKTFTTMASTPTSKTSLASLTPLTTVGFRVSVTDSSGIPGPWSQTVQFLVH
jgi:hypothetical protein